MPTDNFTIRQEGNTLVARTSAGSFLAAAEVPSQKRYFKQTENEVRALARGVVSRTVQACEAQRQSLSYVQAA